MCYNSLGYVFRIVNDKSLLFFYVCEGYVFGNLGGFGSLDKFLFRSGVEYLDFSNLKWCVLNLCF